MAADWRVGLVLLCVSLGSCFAEPVPGLADDKRPPPRPYVQTNLHSYQRGASSSPSSFNSRSPSSASSFRSSPHSASPLSNKMQPYFPSGGNSRSASLSPQYRPSASSPLAGTLGGGSRLASMSPQYRSSPSSPLTGSGYSRSQSLSPQYRTSPKYPATNTLGSRLTGSSASQKAAPGSTTARPPPCDCDCYKKPSKLVCAMDPRNREKETFLNECQVECHNCTMKQRWKVVAYTSCEEYKES